MLTLLSMYEQKRNDICFLCSNALCDIKSFPNICDHIFHYKCLRNYVDNRLEKNESITCPICNKIFHQIANQYKKSNDVLYQNVILSSDESQCCICFSKYKTPVASTDTCSHTFCFECIKKWCTFKHECPMDRMPIKLLLMSDFPGGHITKHEEPPPIQEDLNVTEADNDEILNTTCEICNLGNNDHLLLLCDSCNKGYHIYCLTAPLSEIPEGDWFCEECSNDISSESQVLRGTRRFRRVIDDLQIRYASQNQSNDNRRTRTRGLRDTLSEDSDWVDQIDLPQRSEGVQTRTRAVPQQIMSREGTRRSLRNRQLNSDNSDEEVGRMNSLSLQRRTRARVIEETSSESENSSENNEPDQEIVPNLNERRIRTRAIMQRNENEEPNLSGRNRQGSLSSEPESEIEPCRKKPKLVESSSSSPDDDYDDEEDDEDDDESTLESVPGNQVLTRKRSQNANDNGRLNMMEDEDECPMPSKMRKLRMIDESSRGSESDEDQSSVISENETSKEEIKNSAKSSEETEGEMRMRRISTSSSLSTIPCRTDDRPRGRTHNIAIPKQVPCKKVQDIFSDSSNSDSTDSDYDPSNEAMQSQPSTSRRSSIYRKAKLRNRKRRKPTNTKAKKSSKKKVGRKKMSRSRRTRSDSSTKEEDETNVSRRSLRRSNTLDGETRLPVVSNEELTIKHHNYLAGPDSMSNIIKNENCQSNPPCKDDSTPMNHISVPIHRNTVIPTIDNAPSTSSHSNHSSHHNNRLSAIHCSKETIANNHNAQHVNSVETVQSTGLISNQMRMDFDRIIKRFLAKHCEQGKITKAENISLSERILHKIMARNNQDKIPARSSVEEFSKRYLDFYLKKRK